MRPAEQITSAQVEAVLVSRIRGILEPDLPAIGAATRFGEDLHADSLDLVEVLEATEAELRRRGLAARLPDQDVAEIRTVGDATARILDHLARAAQERDPDGGPAALS